MAYPDGGPPGPRIQFEGYQAQPQRYQQRTRQHDGYPMATRCRTDAETRVTTTIATTAMAPGREFKDVPGINIFKDNGEPSALQTQPEGPRASRSDNRTRKLASR